ncbi:MAG: hypothetical protein FH753_01010 [Firmicutes bacterium]|nr:hypothetical protein [Bacillota bacterium]
MARTIGVLLKMKDQMTAPAKKATKSVKNMKREVKKTRNSIKRFTRDAKKRMANLAKTTIKSTTAIATALGALALKSGFQQAMDLQGFRQQLITATKDTQKATKLMKKSIQFANSTPFETGSVVEATAKMEAYGLNSQKWLKDIADMAGATNKDIMQATEAMADATMGEWERMKEFGIRKDQILAESAKKYGKGVVFDAKGHMLDQAKAMTVLQEIMKKKFKGGAKAQAKTMRGMWSTVTGITKSSLANIVGITNEGTVRQGSMFAKVKDKIQEIISKLQEWQKNGTIKKIGSVTSDVFSKIFNIIGLVLGKAKDTYNFFKDNWSTIKPIIMTLTGAIVAYKTAMLGKKAYTKIATGIKLWKKATKSQTTLQWLLNAAMNANPIMFVITGIALLVGSLILLYKKSDKFRNFVNKKLLPLGKSFVKIIKKSVLKIVKRLKDNFKSLKKNSLDPLIETFNNKILPVLKFVGSIIMWLINNILLPLGKIIGQIFIIKIKNSIIFAMDLFSTFVKSIAQIANGIMTIFGGIIDFIAGIFTGDWEKAWQGIKDIVRGIFDTFAGIIKAPLNLGLDLINKLIRNINDISEIKLPKWLPKIGGKKIGIHIDELPKFAKGGIATRPSIFGEAGAEIAIPLKRNKRSMDLLAQANKILRGKQTDKKVTVNNINTQTQKSFDGNNTQSNKHENSFVFNFNGDIYAPDEFIEKFKVKMTDVVGQEIVRKKKIAKMNMAEV